MKATWSNWSTAEGGAAAPRLPEGAKASHSLPDTGASPPPGPEWRQFSSTGGPHSPHPQEPSSSGSCHRRPTQGPPLFGSIHNLKPQPSRPLVPPAGLLEAKARCPSRPRLRDPSPSGPGPGPLPGNSNAPRERGGGRTLPGGDADPQRRDPALAPTRTRPLAPTAAAPPRRRGTGRRTYPAVAMFEAASRGALRGRQPGGGGAQPGGTRSAPRGQPRAPVPLWSVLT